MEQKPIRLYLISGFLGAGKTTFLRALVQTFQPTRLGVLVNEFGSIGIDGPLVNQSGLKLVEINGGSIFCACIKDGFVRTLKAFSQQLIDVLLIESSGMSDPAGMKKILEGLAPYLDRPYQYMGSVCLVDCTTFDDYVDVLMPVQNQVASADLIIVNKTDLVNEAQLDKIHKRVRMLNSEALVYDTIFAQVPVQVLETQLAYRDFEGESTNTPFNRPNTYTLLSEAALTQDQVRQLCEQLAGFILRFKGFLRQSGGGFWHVEGVAGKHTVQPADFFETQQPNIGKLVLIIFDTDDMALEVQQAWSAVSTEAMELKKS